MAAASTHCEPDELGLEVVTVAFVIVGAVTVMFRNAKCLSPPLVPTINHG